MLIRILQLCIFQRRILYYLKTVSQISLRTCWIGRRAGQVSREHDYKTIKKMTPVKVSVAHLRSILDERLVVESGIVPGASVFSLLSTKFTFSFHNFI